MSIINKADVLDKIVNLVDDRATYSQGTWQIHNT